MLRMHQLMKESMASPTQNLDSYSSRKMTNKTNKQIQSFKTYVKFWGRSLTGSDCWLTLELDLGNQKLITACPTFGICSLPAFPEPEAASRTQP